MFSTRTLTVAETAGLTEQGGEHHEEAGGQIHVDRLNVGYFGKRWVGWGDEGGHGEHSRHAQSYSGRSGASVEPEGDPGDDDDQRGRNVDLDEVVSHWPHKLNLTSQTGVVAWCVDLLFTWWPWRGEILTCRQTGLNSLLTVSEHFELWQWDVPRHLNRVETVIPLVSDVGHSVANWKDRRE